MTAVLIREASTAQAEVVLSAAAVLSAAEAAAVLEITTEIPEMGFSFLHIWQWPQSEESLHF